MIALSESCCWYENFGPQHFLQTAATEICYGAAEGPSRKRARVVNSSSAIPRGGSREPPNRTKGNGCPAKLAATDASTFAILPDVRGTVRSDVARTLVPWYSLGHGERRMNQARYVVERVQTGVRMEKRLLKVLKSFA